jgi:hypothetical protein
MKDLNAWLKVAFVGLPVTIEPEKALRSSRAIDFVVRREFDEPIAQFAHGTPLAELPGVSYGKNGDVVHNADRGTIEDLDALPWVSKVYKNGTSIFGIATFLSCCIRTSRFTQRVAVRRCAPSACGRRRIRATGGGCARRGRYRTNAGGRSTTFRA